MKPDMDTNNFNEVARGIVQGIHEHGAYPSSWAGNPVDEDLLGYGYYNWAAPTWTEQYDQLYVGLSLHYPIEFNLAVHEAGVLETNPYPYQHENDNMRDGDSLESLNSDYISDQVQAASLVPEHQVQEAEDGSNNASTPAVPVGAPLTIQCHHCLQTFKRRKDRVRHENTKHGNTRSVHLCHVFGCPKSQGSGYSRKDKLTEHLWKVHGSLGYQKRV